MQLQKENYLDQYAALIIVPTLTIAPQIQRAKA